VKKNGRLMAMDNRVSTKSRTEITGGIGGIKDWEEHFDKIMEAWGIKDAKRPEFKLGDANKPPLEDEQFDVIAEHMSLSFINMFEETKPLEALLEHLKPEGGTLISTISGSYDINKIKDFLEKKGLNITIIPVSDLYEIETSEKPDPEKIKEIIRKVSSKQITTSAIPLLVTEKESGGYKALFKPSNLGSHMLIAKKKLRT
jgi:ubiquinone/menaquinone biosynthesis C-methylase UbiE